MFLGRRISLVVPAYNEEATIADVVGDYRSVGWVDEILVVDNNSGDRTAQRAREAGATVVPESQPGYGAALQAGMARATGDVLVLTEADGSFLAADLPLLLNPLLEGVSRYDFVIGTRTRRTAHSPLARMRGLGALANMGVAQLLLLHGRPTRGLFSDVGCTQRALTREFYLRLAPVLRAHGPQFAPEMVVAALRLGGRLLEVPVGYHPRRGGVSKHGANYVALARTAMKMIRLIIERRVTFPPKST